MSIKRAIQFAIKPPQLLFFLTLTSVFALRQTAAADDYGNGSVTISARKDFALPYSIFASPEARALFVKSLAEHTNTKPGDTITEKRAYYDRVNIDRVERMKKLYPVRLSTQTIAGVGTDIAEPAQGITAKNTHRVLINLHGGAFLWGAHSGALVEMIPIASLSEIKVIGVDYRQGPEHAFPAASDDVEAVYKELLKQYKPANIGIYGCSTGAFLTGEVTARLIAKKLPLPGAIGMFCGGLVAPDGDSAFVAQILNGEPLTDPLKVGDLPYFKGTNFSDPMVFPGSSPSLLAKFPPTLLITGTRDFALSSVVYSHTLLVQAGVDAELHVWEGMGHSFFSDAEAPESKQAYAVIVRFFDRRLGAHVAR